VSIILDVLLIFIVFIFDSAYMALTVCWCWRLQLCCICVVHHCLLLCLFLMKNSY